MLLIRPHDHSFLLLSQQGLRPSLVELRSSEWRHHSMAADMELLRNLVYRMERSAMHDKRFEHVGTENADKLACRRSDLTIISSEAVFRVKSILKDKVTKIHITEWKNFNSCIQRNLCECTRGR